MGRGGIAAAGILRGRTSQGQDASPSLKGNINHSVSRWCYGKYSLEELRTMQDWIVKFHLQTVPGVTEVLGIGGWRASWVLRGSAVHRTRHRPSRTAASSARRR